MKVLFYPEKPVQQPGHTLSKTITYFNDAGYTLTNDINDDWIVGVHWFNGLFAGRRIPNDNYYKKNIFDGFPNPVINSKLEDVSKSHVDNVFKSIFGYSSMADTDKHGYCVRKSENQGVHDGKIVQTPCIPDRNYVYQKFIDNRYSADMLYDLRLPVFGREIPFVFVKGKSMDATFENHTARKKNYFTDELRNWFTEVEINMIREFNMAFGLDLGEIDVLRDNSTNKLYIIDVNHTPGSSDHVYRALSNGEKVISLLNSRFVGFVNDFIEMYSR